MSKIARFAQALSEGQELTSRQITAWFGLANPRAAVYKLRTQKGLPVYCNEKKGSPNRYKLGTVSRRVLAAGYRALAKGTEQLRPTSFQ